MQRLNSTTHPDAIPQGSETLRQAVRAAILDGEQILLLYTQRYEDYSLPGGGVDPGESLEQALLREVAEETGATNLAILEELGLYEELRPWYKEDADNQRMHSYCYRCRADRELGDTLLEHYERQNGMRPLWVNIHDAIAHNHKTMAASPKAGLSIQRETWLLEYLAARLEANRERVA
ncbi:NUDIX domain-containing protein [Ferrimonas sediminicola]|uniref:NUDIX domain-containing protein n=1 Tax=Ferrimonas sediminicola TaxID=2569538 RepID=A0A4U1BC77_9GAMM|nr:NUDIX domain-containing protein [Ferrimonas sediminicola]TKB47774.1 NUDIX domain-containing protein [Ferrimonas sediminicola]